MKTKRAFTLIEMLVVVAMISLLTIIALATMGSAKYKSKGARCAANMRLWGAATSMYLSDNKDCLPYFGPRSGEYSGPFWFDLLSPYVAQVAEPGSWATASPSTYSSGPNYTNDVRRCPAGNVASANGYPANGNCWIGANFGAYGDVPLSGPYYYGDVNPPLSITRIRKPADALGFMDTLTFYVYSPVEANYRFAVDYDGDGLPDTMPQYSVPYNFAQPKIHENGANVTLLDGHVERVPYKLLWNANFAGTVKHSFWYLED